MDNRDEAIGKFKRFINSKVIIPRFQTTFCDIDCEVLDRLILKCEELKKILEEENEK